MLGKKLRKFNRVVPIRWAINVRDAEAELKNGVLHSSTKIE
jgi:HSP20 family molecular chaperone IbpA